MPGSRCCINDCPSRSHNKLGEKVENGIQFFRFPRWKRHLGSRLEDLTMKRQMAWISAVRRKDITFDNIASSMRVCSLHFYTGKPADEILETHPDWVPSLHLGHSEVKAANAGRFVRRVRRHQMIIYSVGQKASMEALLAMELKRKEEEQRVVPHTVEVELNDDEEDDEKRIKQGKTSLPLTIDEESEEDLMDVLNDEEDDEEEDTRGEIGLYQTSESAEHDEVSCLLEENKHLHSELSTFELTEQFLKGDDEKVKYFTGLPSYSTLQVLLRCIVPFLPAEETQLTHFQMVLLTFMRLKLDMPMEHLSSAGGVQLAAANAAFEHTVGVLYARLSPLVRWPDRERLWVSMPNQFVEIFGEHLTVFVDCFEVSLETHSNADIQILSDYEHSHTLKYLIGITPQGVISFISRGLSGSASDKEIAESCGLLGKLLPGDVVLAGRGFGVEERAGMMCAEVKSPAFAEGRCQLEPKTVEETKVSHLKTQIEKITGSVCNTYKILSSRVPVSSLCEGESVTFTDKVVTVCCALSNVCPSGVLSQQ